MPFPNTSSVGKRSVRTTSECGFRSFNSSLSCIQIWVPIQKVQSFVNSFITVEDSGELATIVFDVFNYLLRPPILEHVKIQELECLISILIKGGYDLERECPDRLALLKDLIRYHQRSSSHIFFPEMPSSTFPNRGLAR